MKFHFAKLSSLQKIIELKTIILIIIIYFNYYSYKVAPASNNEKGILPDFDPFRERKNEHPTSDADTLTHLLKVI